MNPREHFESWAKDHGYGTEKFCEQLGKFLVEYPFGLYEAWLAGMQQGLNDASKVCQIRAEKNFKVYDDRGDIGYREIGLEAEVCGRTIRALIPAEANERKPHDHD